MAIATDAAAVKAHKSFWQSIGGFFKKVGYYVSEGFQKLFGKDAAKHFAVASLAILKSDLGKIALTAVSEAAALTAGVDKRQAAFDKILSGAKAAGLDAKDSIINMLIELALQTVKGTFGQN